MLGLDVCVEREGALRLCDPVTARVLPGYEEEHLARRTAEDRAEREAATRKAAEARVAELEARMGDLCSGRAASGNGG